MAEGATEEKPKYVNDKLDQALLEKRRIFLSDKIMYFIKNGVQK